ncbi:hypothetical protein BDF20DRAFT_942027 [Mycotypha africana]|uniref:uncharacterized protein n=1 Tax=Mycotypha africana TaxID=64632 RepID=UPI002300A9D6|nr:uncharacterized protein BDF20DRAFT_942027 [Mycotypha africana]KAI8977384.1 hypothetical protein BDF20DRAFT_942027 [Mycotypha africana]
MSHTGGYLDSSFDGSDNKNGSGGYARRPLGDQTLRPLTIKQIKNVSVVHDNVCRIDGADVTQITFIGVIRGIQDLQTYNVYNIEDGTGVVECKKWIEQNESELEADARRELVLDTYVRVYGRINSFNGRISVVVHNMRPIVDFNEISYHFLDAIETHLLLTRPNGPNSMLIDQTNDNKASSIEDDITKTLKAFEDYPDGATIDQICHKLDGLYTQDKIRETLDNMIIDGAAYNTTDNEHFKSCFP